MPMKMIYGGTRLYHTVCVIHVWMPVSVPAVPDVYPVGPIGRLRWRLII